MSDRDKYIECSLQQILASIQSQGEGLSRQMYNNFQKLGDSLNRVKEELGVIKQDVKDNRSDLSKIQQDSVYVHTKLEELETKLDKMESRNREKNVKMLGIYEPAPWENWNDIEEVIATLNNFSEKRWWYKDEIEHSYRIGNRKDRVHPRPLIVIFKNKQAKEELTRDYRLCESLRTNGIRIFDDLTLHQRQQIQNNQNVNNVNNETQYKQSTISAPKADERNKMQSQHSKANHTGSGNRSMSNETSPRRSTHHSSRSAWNEWAAAAWGWLPQWRSHPLYPMQPPRFDPSQGPVLTNQQNDGNRYFQDPVPTNGFQQRHPSGSNKTKSSHRSTETMRHKERTQTRHDKDQTLRHKSNEVQATNQNGNETVDLTQKRAKEACGNRDEPRHTKQASSDEELIVDLEKILQEMKDKKTAKRMNKYQPGWNQKENGQNEEKGVVGGNEDEDEEKVEGEKDRDEGPEQNEIESAVEESDEEESEEDEEDVTDHDILEEEEDGSDGNEDANSSSFDENADVAVDVRNGADISEEDTSTVRDAPITNDQNLVKSGQDDKTSQKNGHQQLQNVTNTEGPNKKDTLRPRRGREREQSQPDIQTALKQSKLTKPSASKSKPKENISGQNVNGDTAI